MNDMGADAPLERGPAPSVSAPAVSASRPIWTRLDSTTWMGIFIGTVVVVATAIILLGGNRAPASYPADSPEGALQGYLAAWYDEDYATAYEYFSANAKAQMSFYDFTAYAYGGYQQTVKINSTTGDGDRRMIYLTVEESFGLGPGSSYSRDVSIPMVQEDGAWKVDQPLSGVDPNYGFDF